MDTYAAPGAHRALRRELEESVLPLATSVDGRSFTFQASLHGLALQVGGYVVVETAAAARLGQVRSLAAAAREAGEVPLARDGDLPAPDGLALRLALGGGVLLEGDDEPFHDAAVRPAAPEEVAAWLGRGAPAGARLEAGELALVPGVPLGLDAAGLARHTVVCGQSGSGKTYALGVLLERLLLETTLRIVVLDPNSDHVRIGAVRGDVGARTARRYGRAAGFVDVHRAGAAGGERLRLRFGELEPAARSALLRLDPVADLEEHALLDDLLAGERPAALDALLAAEGPGAARLARRVRNLGLDGLGVWARGDAGSTPDAAVDTGRRGVVVDLGSLATSTEQGLAAAAVLGRLWTRREERVPTLVVIDDAHAVCPAAPRDGLTALATEHALRIAAEGRKFGLFLLVVTQRPQRVHPGVVTQCGNLVLTRLAPADTGFAQETFAFAPPGLVARAPQLERGEAVVAGPICPPGALLRVGRRLSPEGGAEVPADWAGPAVER